MNKILTLRKALLSLLTFIFSFHAALAGDETGIIKGTVITSDGRPAAYVTILFKGFKKSAVTDEDGNFIVRNLASGAYELEISMVGYETVTKQVVVTDKQTVAVTIELKVSAKELEEVTISSGRKFVRTSSDYVAKVPLKNLENSQVYTSVTKELLKEQLVFSVDDATKNAPGVQRMWEATSRSGDGGAYYNARGFIVQGLLRNGVAGNITSRIDAANLESLEVIKGPSATLYGSVLTSYGGLINRVTKKPYSRLGGEINYSTGSYGFNRLGADINTPLDGAKNILFRMNAAYNYEGSFQDNGYEKGFVIAPSLSYKVNDRLSFNFDAELYSGSNTSKQIIFFYFPASQLGANNAKDLGIDYKRSYSSNDIFQVYRNNNFFGQMNYKLSDHWTSQTNYTSTTSFSDGPYAYFYVTPNSVVTGDPNATGADYLTRADQSTAANTDHVTEIQQNFIGDFHIGSLRNRFIGGLDFFSQNSNQLFYGADFDIIKKNGNIPEYANFNKDNLNAVLQDDSKVWTWPYFFKTNVYSAYVSDVVNITSNVIAVAALRIDHFDNKGSFDKSTGQYSGGYKQTAFSPKFGLVYQPITDVISLFANYQNGFHNQTGVDVNGKSFKPEHANQLEGGIKLNAFNSKLTGTLSYYDIKVKDIVRPDPINPNFSLQDGTQISRGFEAEIIANPVAGLNLIAGFAYNDSKFEKSDADVEGKRPETAMSPTTANWWISYKVPYGKWRGVGVGFGGNYASDNKIMNSVSRGEFILPAYTVLNATVFYENHSFRAGLKLDNLTNKEYWIGYTTMNPQKLRSVIASVAFKF